MREVEIHKDLKTLVDAEVAQAVELISSINSPKVALSGGTSGVLIAAGVINELNKANQLDGVQFFMADERFVELEDADSNLGQILGLIGDAKPNVYRFKTPSEADIQTAVSAANADLGIDFGFDLALMGCGPDGHTASLFPGHEYPDQTCVAEVDSPKPPSKRISFGYSAFSNSEHVWFSASGAEKATAVSQALIGTQALPAGRITGLTSTKWFITEELA